MSVALNHPPARMTVAEFLDWDFGDRSGRLWQLVDGEPVAMAPASENHGAIQSELSGLIGSHLIERRSPCRIVNAPGIIPRLRASENWRIPDLGVTCAPARGAHEMIDPVLLAEILSPSNYIETRANHLELHDAAEPARNPVVMHSTRIEVELFRRDDGGEWPERPLVFGDGETFHLACIDLALPVRALYRTTLLAPR